MPKTYYLFNPGRLSRRDHSLKFTPVNEAGKEGKPKFLPVQDIAELFVLGSLDANSMLYNFLAKQRIMVHFFDYYENYTGSFMPKEYLLAGKMQVAQTAAYLTPKKRLPIAHQFLIGAMHNMLKNVSYYQNRGKNLEKGKLKQFYEVVQQADIASIPELMGIEGNARICYYGAFDSIIGSFKMQGRNKQPPVNEVNALLSFGNSLCYALCLSQIYHTQLNPTISFLHEPGFRRYSLALDIAEVFKPLLVDRIIFRLLNQRQLQAKHFDKRLEACHLNDLGRKIFLKTWDERLKETIKHRSLGKKVSYRQLVRLECYKLAKHLLGIDQYRPFKMWW
ncbi:MAG TPA: subtype I-B CRISPR-associated endonuclease Cas1 [Microscillaceae bacterium]|nr:subtype I-B CRISPR-associated endonuclease Cas1 [Microscillaceae bacterium]